MPIDSTARCPQCGSSLPANAPEGLCPRCLGALNLTADTLPTGDAATPSTPPPQPADLAPHFPQLEILEYLGRGGMGIVYKARQKSLNRVVALKLLAPERVTNPRFAAHFAREAHALATLNHPNIVTIHDFGSTGGFYFLLMEYVDGVNLRQLLRSRRLEPHEALAIVPPVCEALQFAHDHGIVHRDIKPENLLLDKSGRAKIADFGIAKMLGAEPPPGHPPITAPAGTPQYVAPEQRDHPEAADHRADIYSLGVVLYELLTGELPGPTLPPPSSRTHGVHIDVRLDEIVLRALEREPARRYQTATEFRTQVETVVHSPQPQAPTPHSAPEASRVPTRKFLRAAAIGFGVAMLVLLAAVAITALTPAYFSSIARLEILPTQDRSAPLPPAALENEIPLIQSKGILEPVIDDLGLRQRWNRSQNTNTPLSLASCLQILARRLEVRLPRNAALIEIQIRSTDSREAAEIANAIADRYRTYQTNFVVRLVDPAEPALLHSSPNLPFNFVLGTIIALLLGLAAEAASLLRAAHQPINRRGTAVAAPTPALLRLSHAQLALGLFLSGTLGTLVLMTLSSRHEMALTFGTVALVLAGVFGWLGRRERAGRGVLISTLLLFIAAGITVLLLTEVIAWPSRAAAARRAAEEAQVAARRIQDLQRLARLAREAEEKPRADLAPALGNPGLANVPTAQVESEPTAEFKVALDGSGTHSSIQSAINLAPAGATIRISPGRYDEYLVITQRLTLVGAGWEQTIIGPTKPWAPPPPEALADRQRRLREASSEQERQRILQAVSAEIQRPVLRIQDARQVSISGIRLQQAGLPSEGSLQPGSAFECLNTTAEIRDCAVVGSPGNGISITGSSQVRLQHALVAAAWNTGLLIGQGARAEVSDCDIRNCYYAGIVVQRHASSASIERCRISGSAWHGIRYDDVAPVIRNNLIFAHARSGIYASGRTGGEVTGNLFLANEMNGMSCWYANHDTIVGNTFAENRREGLSVLGAAAPTIRSNVFCYQPIAVFQGRISGSGANAQQLAIPELAGNLFWANATNILGENLTANAETQPTPSDPQFLAVSARNYRLSADSPARRSGIGAADPLPLASPWALQPEEIAIIPEGATRDSRSWRRPRAP